MLSSFKSSVAARIRRSLGVANHFDVYERRVFSDAYEIECLLGAISGRSSMNPLFIDMGSNLGQGFAFFSKYYVPGAWDYVFVEPNPYCVNELRARLAARASQIQATLCESAFAGKSVFNYQIIEATVAGSDGITLLYGLTEDSRGQTSDGASINSEHNSDFYSSDPTTALEVQSFAAGPFVKRLSEGRPCVVVKMDIEGAEYVALENMLSCGALDCVSRMYIEWHAKYFSKELRGKYEKIEKDLKDRLPGFKVFDWV